MDINALLELEQLALLRAKFAPVTQQAAHFAAASAVAGRLQVSAYPHRGPFAAVARSSVSIVPIGAKSRIAGTTGTKGSSPTRPF